MFTIIYSTDCAHSPHFYEGPIQELLQATEIESLGNLNFCPGDLSPIQLLTNPCLMPPFRSVSMIINRPGVAGVVLQTPSSLSA